MPIGIQHINLPGQMAIAVVYFLQAVKVKAVSLQGRKYNSSREVFAHIVAGQAVIGAPIRLNP